MNHQFVISILISTIAILAIGCTPEPEIVLHRVQKERSGLEKLRQQERPPEVKESSKSEATRMAVAIFEKPEATWFFKISGPAKRVDDAEPKWTSFFDSVKFDDGQPIWDLPEGWTKAGQKPMRFATLVIDDQSPPLELAISSLGPDQDILTNANRWRGQIGLKPIKNSELDETIKSRKSDSGKFLVFDAVGTGSGKMAPPFAGGGAAPFAGGGAAPFAGGGASAGPTEKLDYELPTGWTKLESSRMVPVRLEKESDGAKAQITIVELPADANEWDPNVVRWANQVGLGGLTKEEFENRTSVLKIDGVEGKLVDLVDPDSESDTGLIGGMIKRDGSAWFLKLSGDKQIVDDSRDALEKFTESIRFK